MTLTNTIVAIRLAERDIRRGHTTPRQAGLSDLHRTLSRLARLDGLTPEQALNLRIRG